MVNLENIIKQAKKGAAIAGANLSTLWGLSELTEYLPDLSGSSETILTGAATLSLIPLNKYVIAPLAKVVSEHQFNQLGKSIGKAALIGCTIIAPLLGMQEEIKEVYNDSVAPFASTTPEARTQVTETPRTRDVVERNKKIGFEEMYNLPDFSQVELADKSSTIGRIQRAYRWKPIGDVVEDAYGIPDGTLLGMAMHESYADPLQPNGTNDGGIGLLHMQGTTAKSLGLSIYGNSHIDSDKRHGENLKKMIEKCDSQLACIAKEDERGHPVKNLDAAARYMLQGKKRHGSWDHGIQWYRGPGLVSRGTGIRYLHKVKSLRDAFNGSEFKRAERDFNQRNPGITFQEWGEEFHKYCETNMDLDTYKKEMKK
jgi:hypothetical protein